MKAERVRFNVAEARDFLQRALSENGGELDDVARELLEAVKHIDNARKMLREESGK